MNDKIYFTLDKRTPMVLHAQYNGITESTAINLVPKVMDSKIPLLDEENIYLAEEYLKLILNCK